MVQDRLWRLVDELNAQLDEFLRLKDEIYAAQQQFGKHEPNIFELRALGSILRDVYQNAGVICIQIAKEVDQRSPIGSNWNGQLLDEMAKPVPRTRPAVLQTETASLLDEYRRFRHLFRNIYGFRLSWIHMKPLLDNAATAVDIFAADIKQFIAFLRLMSEKDEPPQ